METIYAPCVTDLISVALESASTVTREHLEIVCSADVDHVSSGGALEEEIV